MRQLILTDQIQYLVQQQHLVAVAVVEVVIETEIRAVQAAALLALLGLAVRGLLDKVILAALPMVIMQALVVAAKARQAVTPGVMTALAAALVLRGAMEPPMAVAVAAAVQFQLVGITAGQVAAALAVAGRAVPLVVPTAPEPLALRIQAAVAVVVEHLAIILIIGLVGLVVLASSLFATPEAKREVVAR